MPIIMLGRTWYALSGGGRRGTSVPAINRAFRSGLVLIASTFVRVVMCECRGGWHFLDLRGIRRPFGTIRRGR